MELKNRNFLVYALLFVVWALVLGWQVEEHVRVREAARAALADRARDISTTLGIVLRSQRRFGGVISRERLESSMTELVKPGELTGIKLLNAAGDTVAAAGTLPDVQPGSAAGPAEHWDEQTMTLMNLVDLGTNLTRDIEGTAPAIILSRQDFTNRFSTNRPAMPPPEGPREMRPEPPPGPPPNFENTNAATAMPGDTNNPPRPREARPRFSRPRWMSEDEYKAIVQKQGAHAVLTAADQDLWLRAIIVLLASVSAVGSALAWRNIGKSAELQLRLVRASELNTHLREMNLAAAGLAHETRNPLNIIRGMAQMLSKQPGTPDEIRDKSRAIVNETDKVTAQLNEFINYSKPREVRRAPLALAAAANEIVRALNYDLEEKKIRLEVKGEYLTVLADEQLFRQALFNLVLNAIQAVDTGGQIQIVAQRNGAAEASLEIRDDGPGVPAANRQEVFKPYFTTHQKGTGLGLAVVQQIILAHGWEIQCLANEPKGAIFRLTHLKLAGKN
jgi:signal transduction histidine kinase